MIAQNIPFLLETFSYTQVKNNRIKRVNIGLHQYINGLWMRHAFHFYRVTPTFWFFTIYCIRSFVSILPSKVQHSECVFGLGRIWILNRISAYSLIRNFHVNFQLLDGARSFFPQPHACCCCCSLRVKDSITDCVTMFQHSYETFNLLACWRLRHLQSTKSRVNFQWLLPQKQFNLAHAIERRQRR